MTGDIIAAVLGLDSPEVAAFKVGAAVFNELLKHPDSDSSGPVAVISSTPGRLRLRVASMKRSPETVARIEDRLLRMQGVREVAANAVTGTALICYDVDRTSVEALRRAAEYALAAGRVVRGEESYQIPRWEAVTA